MFCCRFNCPKGNVMKKNFLKILLTVISLIVVAGVVWFVGFGRSSVQVNKIEDLGQYRLYDLGTQINFKRGGDSLKYIDVKNGWGGQEPEYRCTVGNETLVNLYIPESSGTVLKLHVYAFGVFAEKDLAQNVDVYANDQKIASWSVVGLDTYMATIPSSVAKDNKLTIKFVPNSPYCPVGDNRMLGMAVHSMKITKPVAGKTRVRLSLWLKNLFF